MSKQMIDATDTLRDILCALVCNDRDTAYMGMQDMAEHLAGGGDMPSIEVLGPADLREPDAFRVRVAV